MKNAFSQTFPRIPGEYIVHGTTCKYCFWWNNREFSVWQLIQRDESDTTRYFRHCHFQVKVNLHGSETISFLFFFESYQHFLFSRNRNSKLIDRKSTAGICMFRKRNVVSLPIIEQIQQINFQKLLFKEDYFMQPQNKGVLEVTILILNSVYCSRSATGSNQKQFPSQHPLKISERYDCQL